MAERAKINLPPSREIKEREIQTRTPFLQARIEVAAHHLYTEEPEEMFKALDGTKDVSIPSQFTFVPNDSTKLLNWVGDYQRRKYWENKQGSLDSQWSASVTALVRQVDKNSSKASFLKKAFEIDVATFSETTAASLLQKEYGLFSTNAKGQRTSNIEMFISRVLHPYMDGESLDKDKVIENIENIQWFAGIYGQQTAELIVNNIRERLSVDELYKKNSIVLSPQSSKEERNRAQSLFIDETRRALTDSPTQKEKELLNVLKESTKSMWDSLSEEEKETIFITNGLNMDPLIVGVANSYITTGKISLKDLSEKIVSGMMERRKRLKEKYKIASGGKETRPRYPLEKQKDDLFPDGTCYLASSGNALRSLGVFTESRHSEEKMFEAWKHLPKQRDEKLQDIIAATPWEMIEVLKHVASEVSVTQEASLEAILEAVDRGSAAVVEVRPNHVGTIPAGSKVFLQNGEPCITVYDSETGTMLDFPLKRLIVTYNSFVDIANVVDNKNEIISNLIISRKQ